MTTNQPPNRPARLETAAGPAIESALRRYVEPATDPTHQRWLAEALGTLLDVGPVSRQGALTILDRRAFIIRRPFSWWQRGMGVRWSWGGGIEIPEHYVNWSNPPARWLLSVLVHEATHLAQGRRVALTQLGEVHAWHAHQQAAEELGVTLPWMPAEVGHWGAEPSEANFRTAAAAIIRSQPRSYLFWLLPRLPYRGYDASIQQLPRTHDGPQTQPGRKAPDGRV